jgi:uncharacterized membrane protein required for colicin V production
MRVIFGRHRLKEAGPANPMILAAKFLPYSADVQTLTAMRRLPSSGQRRQARMLKSLNLSVFDLFFLVFLAIGILRGRKRGISEELLDLIQWIGVVVGAALAYPGIGGALITYAKFPTLLANLLGYIIAAATIVFLFKNLKRGIGEKLVQGDVFGRFEFYLGMVAGFVRFLCIAIFLLALLHAKYSTPQERERIAKLQRDNFGSISFPTFDEMQYSVFYKSASGNLIRTNFSLLLIRPVAPGPDRSANTIARRREAEVNQIFK